MEFILSIKMKRLAIIVLFLSLLFSQGYKNNISFTFERKPLNEILDFLVSEYQLIMIYQDTQVEEHLVSAQCHDCTLEEALNCILKNIPITWIRLNDQIVLTYKDTTYTERNHTKIYGQIIDAKDKDPLPYANVMIKGTKRGTVSDSSGLFAFLDVSENKDTLEVHYIGYASKEIPAFMSSGKKIIKVELEESPLYTDRITVTDQKNKSFEISGNQAGKIQFSPLAIDFIPSTGNADFQRTLQLMPGISAGYDKPSELRVLGGDRTHNLFYLDGIPVMLRPEFYFGMLNPFHQKAIEAVKVYKGGYPAQYGDCIGGIVELTGNTVRDNRFSFGAGVDIFQMNGFVQIPVSRKLKWFFAVNRSFNNIDDGPIYRDIYTAAKETFKIIYQTEDLGLSVSSRNDHYSFFNLMSKVYYEASSKDKLSFTFYSGSEKELTEGKNNMNTCIKGSDIIWRWKNTGLSGQWSHRWNSDFTSNLAVVYSTNSRPFNDFGYEYDLINSQLTEVDTIFFRHIQKNIIIKNRNNLDFNSVKLTFGSEIAQKSLVYDKNRIHYHQYSASPFDKSTGYYKKDSRISKNVFYIQSSWSPIRKINLGLGLRAVDYKVLVDVFEGPPREHYKPRLNYLPRTSLNLFLSENLTLSTAWGRYYQYFYSMNDMGDEIFDLFRLWWYVDKELPPISADHTIISLSYGKSSYRFNVSTYYKNLRAIVIHENDIPIYLRVNQTSEYSEENLFYYGSGTAKGLELSLQKTSGKLTGWLGYNYGKVIYRFPDINKGEPFLPKYHRVHELKSAAKLSIGNWRISAVGIFASPVASFQDEFVYTYGGSDFIKYDFSLPSYQRIDINISRLFDNFMFMDWELGISLLNVLNHKTVLDRLISNYKNPDLEYMEIIERRMLPFIPLVYLNVRYR
jgi:ferric enterobactin receptor